MSLRLSARIKSIASKSVLFKSEGLRKEIIKYVETFLLKLDNKIATVLGFRVHLWCSLLMFTGQKIFSNFSLAIRSTFRVHFHGKNPEEVSVLTRKLEANLPSMSIQ